MNPSFIPDLRLGEADDHLPRIEGATLLYADVDYGINVYEGDQKGDQFDWLDLAKETLLPDGVLALSLHASQIGDAMTAAREAGFSWFQTIIWYYRDCGNTPKNSLATSYEPILVFRKDELRCFHPERILEPTLYPGRRDHRNTEGKTGKLKHPSDVWLIPRVHGQSKDRIGFECQKPVELLRRLVLLFTDVGDLVVDPRAGTGTTLVVARFLSRQSIGIERHPKRYEMALKRINKPWQPSLFPSDLSDEEEDFGEENDL